MNFFKFRGMLLWKARKVTNAILHLWKKQSVCESQRGGFWEEKERTWGCVYLCPRGASAMCALCGSHQGFREYERKAGGGKRDEQCSLVHCALSAALPLACFVHRRLLWNPLRNGKSGPSETTTQTPYPTPAPLYPQTLGNKDEGRRGAKEEECMLQWLLHSGAVAPHCVKAAECFQFLSTLSPRRVRMNRTNERRRVTGCERQPEKREKGNNRVQETKLEQTFRKCTQRKTIMLRVCSLGGQDT